MTESRAIESLFAEPVGSTRVPAAAPWLEDRRERAAKTFRSQGIPHRRIEAWKYSDLRVALEAAKDIDVGGVTWEVSEPLHGIELFDLASHAVAPQWVQAHLGKSAADSAMPAASLMFAQSGFALRIPRNVHVAQPVRLAFSGSGQARALIVLEEGAAAIFIETPSPARFSNIGIEAVIGANASMTLVRTSDAAPSAIQVEDVAVRVARDASFKAHLESEGASLARLNLRVTLREPGARAEISGVSVIGEALHSDLTTEIYHAAGKTTSVQVVKKAVGGRARAVYQGKITVAEGANGSDSRQTAKAILLSDRAEADLKPELEILADDVKCAHGAAVGDLDPESLFYLRSRGVPEEDARNLLIRAFLEDAILPIVDEDVRAEVWKKVERALARILEAPR
jgi:Fe-S cluster assembly protein SufD